jgi:hypothetical protein
MVISVLRTTGAGNDPPIYKALGRPKAAFHFVSVHDRNDTH